MKGFSHLLLGKLPFKKGLKGTFFILFLPLSFLFSEWQIVDMGGTVVGMNGITIAEGRNDGIKRVYAGSFNGHLYEYTFSSGNIVEIKPISSPIFTSHTLVGKLLTIYSPKEGVGDISIYNLSGARVFHLKNFLFRGKNTIELDRKIVRGIYLIAINWETGDKFVSKILKLR